MRPIADDFSSPTGRWLEYWTPDGVSDNAWIDTVSHTDLRSFINLDIERNRTQSELDQYSQTLLEINPPLGTQSNLESRRIVVGEMWGFTGTGFHTPNNPTPSNRPHVGLISSPANLRAIELTASGAGIAMILTSGIVVDSDPVTAGIDCSTVAFGVDPHLVISFDSTADVVLGDLTAAESYIQLGSNTDGTFTSPSGTLTGDEEGGESLKVPFSSSVGGSHWVAIPLTGLHRDTFDHAAVTSVRIRLKGSAATLGDKMRLLHGIRVVPDTTTYAANDRTIDFETRHRVLMNQVGLDGAAVGTGIPKLVRGTDDDTQNDPRFVDGSFGVHFSTGGGLVQAGDNTIDLILREGTFSDVNLSEPSHIVARLRWDSAGAASYQVFRYDNNTTAVGDTGLVDWAVTLDRAVDEDVANLRGIDADIGKYYFEATAIGSMIELRLRQSDALNVVGNIIANVVIPNPVYRARRGRCGFTATFSDYDAYIDELAEGTIGYGTIRTRAFRSPTPVDAVQLISNSTPDLGLSQEVFWVNSAERFVDTEKSPSGKGSFRTKSGLVTSNFLIEDWKHSYVKMSIWVGSTVSYANQPYLFFESTVRDEDDAVISFRVNLERLQPSQWNEVYVDLLPYRNKYANLFYRVSLLAPQDGGLGLFWVDDPTVAQRSIEWEARAKPDEEWRSFRNYVNDPFGGVHFPPEERGRDLQIQGTALTPDAKIISYKVIPRYAQLGSPLFDQSYRSR